MSTYRYDPLEDRWTIIARHRLKKPTLKAKDIRMVPAECPFCEGNEALSDAEIDASCAQAERSKNTPGWINRVVANRYRAVSIETSAEVDEEGIYRSMGGFGAHEILIDTTGHDSDLALMSLDETVSYLRMVAKRLDNLSQDSRIAHVSVFKNVGILAGETMAHPHTQIVALPFIPSHIASMYEREAAYHRAHHAHLLLDEVAQTIDEEARLIAREGDFCLYTPFASRYPFELRIAPMVVLTSLANASSEQLESLALLMRRSVHLMKLVLGKKVAYNMVIRDSMRDDKPCHTVYIALFPRLFGVSALESEEGISINPMPPEEAAKLYKERL